MRAHQSLHLLHECRGTVDESQILFGILAVGGRGLVGVIVDETNEDALCRTVGKVPAPLAEGLVVRAVRRHVPVAGCLQADGVTHGVETAHEAVVEHQAAEVAAELVSLAVEVEGGDFLGKSEGLLALEVGHLKDVRLARGVALQEAEAQLRQGTLLALLDHAVLLDDLVEDLARALIQPAQGTDKGLDDLAQLALARTRKAVPMRPAVEARHALGGEPAAHIAQQRHHGRLAATEGKEMVAGKDWGEEGLHPTGRRRQVYLVQDALGNGGVRRVLGQYNFLLKGFDKFSVEMGLFCLSYNLRRVISLKGVPALVAALR